MQAAALGATPPGQLLWRARLDAAIHRSRKVRGANYVQLATVDKAGAPHVRTVVFRGFEPAAGEFGCVMRMITDTRSDKIEQLRTNPLGELVWWFARSAEQFRVSGSVEIVDASPCGGDAEALLAARRAQWGNLSDRAREQFFGPAPGTPFPQGPSEPSGEVAVAAVPVGGRGDDGRVLPPPECFALLLLRPRRVDHLCLDGNERHLDVCSAQGAALPEGSSFDDVWATRRIVG
mmetsp:Transcript_6963/g.17815  ORF Transcript_6963/g.17815 Transcript_6963/m.17815 type:complete len:234 (+) Transcript_6963:139-840(+)